MNELRQCIRNVHSSILTEREWELVSEMVELSHQLNFFNDTWGITIDNVSLFEYNSTLAPWFFGLVLVRFEHRPSRGRVLELI